MQRLCPACARQRDKLAGRANLIPWIVGGAIILLILFVLGLFWFVQSSPTSPRAAPPPIRTVPVEPRPAPAPTAPLPQPPDAAAPVADSSQPFPIPIGSPGDWVGSGDYPPRMLREEREGTTAFRLTVGPNGRATDCAITQSSGHRELDDAACRALLRRARFDPARDDNGRARFGQWASRVRWQIPR